MLLEDFYWQRYHEFLAPMPTPSAATYLLVGVYLYTYALTLFVKSFFYDATSNKTYYRVLASNYIAFSFDGVVKRRNLNDENSRKNDHNAHRGDLNA
jgi:hypothetical protein